MFDFNSIKILFYMSESSIYKVKRQLKTRKVASKLLSGSLAKHNFLLQAWSSLPTVKLHIMVHGTLFGVDLTYTEVGVNRRAKIGALVYGQIDEKVIGRTLELYMPRFTL